MLYEVITGLDVGGSTLVLDYYAFSWYGVTFVNTSDPANLNYYSSYIDKGWAEHVAVSGDIVLLGANDDGLKFVDISDPSNPQETASLESFFDIKEMVAADNLAYINEAGSLFIVDFENP